MIDLVENWEEVRKEMLTNAHIRKLENGYHIEYDNSEVVLIEPYEGIDINEIIDEEKILFQAILECVPISARDYEDYLSYDRV